MFYFVPSIGMNIYLYFYTDSNLLNFFLLKHRAIYFLAVCAAISMLLGGCKLHSGKPAITEGIIQYKIEYKADSSDIPTQLLPKIMTLTFKNYLSMNRITGFMGLFEFTNYTDANKKVNTTCLKFFDNKYSYTSQENEPLCCFDPFRDMNVQKIEGETKVIAGYPCLKAIARFAGHPEQDFDIYYTEDIRVKSPNLNNPFHDIEGVLMDFTVKMNKVRMHITATAVKPMDISRKTFKLSGAYMPISKQKLEEYLYQLME